MVTFFALILDKIDHPAGNELVGPGSRLAPDLDRVQGHLAFFLAQVLEPFAPPLQQSADGLAFFEMLHSAVAPLVRHISKPRVSRQVHVGNPAVLRAGHQ